MNRKTHPSEEAFDGLCREIVHAARAREEDIHAAANAPFLYQRLRVQIAAESNPIANIVPRRSSTVNFIAALRTWARFWSMGRWALAVAAIALVVLVGWQWRNAAAPPVASRQAASPSAQQVAKSTAEMAPTTTARAAEHAAQSSPIADKIRAAKSAPNKPVRVVSRVSEEVEEAEITTEFLPLTYTAQRDEQNAQIVRMEMPRSVLATLGVPVANVTGDRIKADVMLRDDGVALAIRFIQEQ